MNNLDKIKEVQENGLDHFGKYTEAPVIEFKREGKTTIFLKARVYIFKDSVTTKFVLLADMDLIEEFDTLDSALESAKWDLKSLS